LHSKKKKEKKKKLELDCWATSCWAGQKETLPNVSLDLQFVWFLGAFISINT